MTFGQTTLKQLYTNFGDEVTFTLNPFVFGSTSALRCFDEASPCTLEQESMNVIANNTQDVYVPWLVCMDSSGDQLSSCDSQVGISAPASTAPSDILNHFFTLDEPITGTPTVNVNGKSVKTSYSAISRALCKADSTLSGCAVDFEDHYEHEFCAKPTALEV